VNSEQCPVLSEQLIARYSLLVTYNSLLLYMPEKKYYKDANFNSTNGLPEVSIYTDGACRGNPGPGGYGVVMLYGKRRKELSGGFRRTTNNRMEIMGPITGLAALKKRCNVTVYSDSQYVVNSVMLGWARKWKKNGWKRNKHDPALNADLWDRLLSLCDMHECKFVWVAGHAGITENERCDELSVQAAMQNDLPVDKGYEDA
jgi:ribonuclease HI